MPMNALNRRLTDAFTMFVVTALSLLLLVYVGFAEGKRIYEQFHIEKVAAHGRIVQSAIENYLRVGLPINQYAGFSTLADPVVQAQDIDAVAVYDQGGRRLFLAVDKSGPKLPELFNAIRDVGDDIQLHVGDTHYQLGLPLRTRFERAGSVVVLASTKAVSDRLESSFQVLVYAAIGLSGLFAVFVLICAPYFSRTRTPWLQIGYAVTFLTMAAIVVVTLVNLYSDGVQAKVQSSAATLAQRLNDIVEFNLRFRDFEGLQKTFSEYKRLNPEIKEAALIFDGVVQISTDGTKLGNAWVSDLRSYEYLVDLTGRNQAKQMLAVLAPKDLVYQRVERSVRNFLVLFVASGFLAGLFLQVAISMQRLRSSNSGETSFRRNLGNETALIVVKPIFFLAVFFENLTYSFLPKFMQDAAAASGMSLGFASAPFTLYYLCFALILIPAGHFAERRGPKSVICWGMLLSSVSVICLIMPLGIVPLTILRALAGIGQGMLFIGIQSYILAVSPPERKTQGAGIIVFGFQGGMIAGMAIGSLLVVYLKPQGVFMLSGAIGLATAAYSVLLIPRDIKRSAEPIGLGHAINRVVQDLGQVMRSGEFVKTMLCIGVPAKAILTGAVTFALPLLLGQQGYRQEEIGQIIMLYGIGVVGATIYVSRMVDRTGNTDSILFWGACVSGLGLILVGLMGSTAVGNGAISTAIAVIGVIIVGIAHGCINAPVVTHIAHSALATKIGANSATTAYRFLERVGHVAGPLLVGQFFLHYGQSPHVLAWLGFATTALGFIFVVHTTSPQRSPLKAEVAK